MNQQWSVQGNYLELKEMPFYWRLSDDVREAPDIPPKLPIRISVNQEYDYLQYKPLSSEWAAIDCAYRKNENIGFLNPESGQLQTYGSSVNGFFLEIIESHAPKAIYEIGCGAGFSIQFLKENGWPVVGIDPSEYSLKWSERLGFDLISSFFSEGLFSIAPDFVYCNDVFEHVRDVELFSEQVCNSLSNGGVFCFATTNSTQSIAIGDISMLEHQHVNMFTERSISLILRAAGFNEVNIRLGSYGNTFHVCARKSYGGMYETPPELCTGFIERAESKLTSFNSFYIQYDSCHYYVPLRCIPYLASVGDYGKAKLFDSNASWRNKFIDGYYTPIGSLEDITYSEGDNFLIGSLTFFNEIKASLEKIGYAKGAIHSIRDV